MTHQRMKPKLTGKTSEERAFHGMVAQVPCLVCGKPAEVHHILHHGQAGKKRDHRLVAPLCPDHHRGKEGVHGLGGEAKFLERWGVDLVTWAVSAWITRDTPDASFWSDSIILWKKVAGRQGGFGIGLPASLREC